MQNADFSRVTQCLVNDAIPFRQTKERGDLFFAGAGVQIELQANLLESDWHILGHPKSAAKVEISLSVDRRVA